MSIIAGIDEAGYGPTLGPLVVTATIFEVPGFQHTDLWELLHDSVTKDETLKGELLAVTDSKKLFSRSKGIRKLEESALSFMFQKQGVVKSFKTLVKGVSNLTDTDFDIYPWYKERDVALSVEVEHDKIENFTTNLKSSLKKSKVKLLGIHSIPVSVHNYNIDIVNLGNKSVLLFNKCATLLVDIWNKYGEKSPTVYVDKHGGRDKYMPLLYPYFEGSFIRIHKESATESIYEITYNQKSMLVYFIQGSETKHLPIAISSICCKYIRELFMHMFNAYWTEKLPDLKPTAGYFVDGKRFLEDIAETKTKLGIKDEILIRLK